MPPRIQCSEAHRLTLKITVAIFALFVLTEILRAQGVESPPVRSFKPDTSLPRVNVPEFVITGKAQTEVTGFNKESIEIDSLYFQRKTLAGLSMDLPTSQSLSLQSSELHPANLFARLSTGSYVASSYLLSGNDEVGGARLNGSVNGNYTSGFNKQTVRRDISIRAGIAKGIEFYEGTKTSDCADIDYSRATYFLYGTGIPDLLRTTNQFAVGLRSDMNFTDFPLTAGLSFDRFSVQDYWKDIQSTVTINVGTVFQQSDGRISLDGLIRLGHHGTTSSADTSKALTGIDQSFYNLTVDARYDNSFGNFSYSIGLDYFQYSDDSSRGIAKLYPDLRGTYKLDDEVSLFARFFGDVENSSLSTFFDRNRYVDANFPLRNRQVYADFTVGGDWMVTDEISVSPQFNVDASRFYPIFVTFPMAIIGADTSRSDNRLLYASKATIFTTSITAQYKKDKLGADATLDLRSGTADSLRSIPNLAPVDLTVGGNYQVNPQFNVRAYIFILSSRYSDIDLSNRLNSVWLLNFHLSYDLKLGRFPVELFGDGRNVLDQKYYIWKGYQEFPVGFFIGISSKIF